MKQKVKKVTKAQADMLAAIVARSGQEASLNPGQPYGCVDVFVTKGRDGNCMKVLDGLMREGMVERAMAGESRRTSPCGVLSRAGGIELCRPTAKGAKFFMEAIAREECQDLRTRVSQRLRLAGLSDELAAEATKVL